MNDYLSNVAARSFGLVEPIQARLASRFEPQPAVGWPLAAALPGAEPAEEGHRPAGITFEEAQWSTRPASAMPSTTAPQVLFDASHPAAARLTTMPALLAASQPPPARATLHQTDVAPMATGPTATDRGPGDYPGQSVHSSSAGDAVLAAPWSGTSPLTGRRDDARQPERPASLPLRSALSGTPATALVPSSGIAPTSGTVRVSSSGSAATSGTVVARPSVTPPVEPVAAVTPATAALAPAVPPSIPPTIRVTIGRVDVRAIMPPAPPAPRSRPSRSGPTLSLEDYLQQRREGRR